jgi:hypothetical protein
MLHSQSAVSMTLDQDFPVSIEAQFLGGNGTDERTTLNVWAHYRDERRTGNTHCNNFDQTYHGDVWVTADFVVLGDSVIHHIQERYRGDLLQTTGRWCA